MKFGVVAYKNSLNIGDDIQTYAAMNLLPRTDFFLEREELHHGMLSTDTIKVICNGWFMHKPENWPPMEQIKPLFISLHITDYSDCKRVLFTPRNVAYFKENGPIGCRDYSTLKLFQTHKIKSYYSGCLTLTLPNFSDISKTDEILFVDAMYPLGFDYDDILIDKLVPNKYKNNVTKISHIIPELPSLSMEERMRKVKKLLQRYASARMVITSRIHSALPCLAIGTPVYFVDCGFDYDRSRSRFDGVFNLLNVIVPILPFNTEYKLSKFLRMIKLHRFASIEDQSRLINWENPENEGEDFKLLKQELTARVTNFIIAQ